MEQLMLEVWDACWMFKSGHASRASTCSTRPLFSPPLKAASPPRPPTFLPHNLRKRSDKDSGATTPNGAVHQIASKNSTLNLFQGGNQARSWMNGTAAASTPISRTKPNSVVTSSTCGNNRSKPNTTTTILPSPVPSNEPSPAQESVERMAPVTRRGMDMQAEILVVRSPEGQEEPTMGQQWQTNNEPQFARTPETMESPIIIEQGHTLETTGVRSPLTQRPSPMIQQRNTPTEAQAVQSPTTQQPPPMVQQGNMPTSTEQVHFLASRQPLSMSQRRKINYRPQAVQSPTTQQPPPTVQQGHANTAPQAVQGPHAGSVPYNSVYLPLAPAPPTKKRKMTSANHPTSLKTMVPIIEQHVNSCGGMQALVNNIKEGRRMQMAQMPSNAPHPMLPNMPTRVLSPSNMPSAAQAGQPRPIRTNVMPSEVLIASPQSATLPSHRHAWAPQVPSSHQTPSGSVPERSPRSLMPAPLVRPPQTSQRYSISPDQQYMQNQAQNLQQPYQPNQAQTVQPRQGQVNDIARTALRNASISASLVQFPGTGGAAFSPLLAGPVRRVTSPTYNVASEIANMPAGYRLPQQQQHQHQQQHVSLTPLIPPVGYIPPYQFPQPDRSALHQARLRSPVLRPIDADERLATDHPAQKYYQAVQGFAAGPTTPKDLPLLTELTFVVDKFVFRNIAEDKLSDPSAPLLRVIRQGSLQFRVRCIRVHKGIQMEPSDFIVADTNFPPTIFMEMNDSVLEIRRKNYHGKDPPVDVTYHVYDCGPKKENLLRIFVPRPAKTTNGIFYSIAIEVVEVFRHQQIIDMCNEQRVTAKDMIADIRAKLSHNNVDEDDDVALVSANLTIDLVDPFTCRIFTTPVRGVRCRHRECFDLEAFLVSRSSKPQEVACMPDVWKCPLCGGDASPRNLRVDDFLVAVRESLERKGELDVKAILVTEDGEWTVKPEAAPAGRRKSRGGGAGGVQSHHYGSTGARWCEP